MHNVLNGHGLALDHFSEAALIEALDHEAIYEDLAEGASDALVFRPERWRLSDHDHLVLARASRTGRYLGLLAASVEEIGGEAVLTLDTVFIAPAARSLNLLQRMLSVAILRMEGVDAAPNAIGACTSNLRCLAALHAMADRFAGSVLYPTPSPVVQLSTAALARRLAARVAPRAPLHLATGRIAGPRERTLALLDLRNCPPDEVVEAASAICRARPGRAVLRQVFGEDLPAARCATGL